MTGRHLRGTMPRHRYRQSMTPISHSRNRRAASNGPHFLQRKTICSCLGPSVHRKQFDLQAGEHRETCRSLQLSDTSRHPQENQPPIGHRLMSIQSPALRIPAQSTNTAHSNEYAHDTTPTTRQSKRLPSAIGVIPTANDHGATPV